MSDQNDDNQFEAFLPDDGAEPEAEASTQPASGNNRSFLITMGVIGGVFLLVLIAMGVFAATYLPKQAAARKTEAAMVYVQNTATAVAATESEAARAQALLPTVAPTNTPVPPTEAPAATNTPVPAKTEMASSGSSSQAASAVPADPGANKAETPAPQQQTQMAGTQASGGANTAKTTPEAPKATLAPNAARTATLAVLLTQVAGTQKLTPVAGAATTGGSNSTTGGTTASGGAANPAAAGGAGTATALPQTGFADEVGLPGLFGLALALVALIFIVRGLRFTTR